MKVSEGAVIEVGSEKGFRPLQIQQLKGSGATFYLPGGRAGSINQTQGGEGKHSVYLGTSGASITETKLVQHVFSYDDSLSNAGRAEFILANDGLWMPVPTNTSSIYSRLITTIDVSADYS